MKRLFQTAILLSLVLLPTAVMALPEIDISIGSTDEPNQLVTGMKILGLLTILSIAPAILLTMTSFTRILIVFSFLRQAVGTQQVPPNQVMVGLALFLTMFVMAPVGTRINEEAVIPYKEGKLDDGQALDAALKPVRDFMMLYTREKDLVLFYEISNTPLPATVEDVSMRLLIPAFVISELKTAFEMGFMLFVRSLFWISPSPRC
jgi:flagellar biosynthetic protein FliP